MLGTGEFRGAMVPARANDAGLAMGVAFACYGKIRLTPGKQGV